MLVRYFALVALFFSASAFCAAGAAQAGGYAGLQIGGAAGVSEFAYPAKVNVAELTDTQPIFLASAFFGYEMPIGEWWLEEARWLTVSAETYAGLTPWRVGHDVRGSGMSDGVTSDARLDASTEFYFGLSVRLGVELEQATKHPRFAPLGLYVLGGPHWELWQMRENGLLANDQKNTNEPQLWNGWHVGAGAQYRLSPDWRVRLEYRYTTAGRNEGTIDYDPRVQTTTHGASIGLIYLFRNAAIQPPIPRI